MTHQNIGEIREFLLTKLGLAFAENREKELYQKLSKASKNFNFTDTDDFIDWLKNQPLNDKQIQLLASSLTVGETYFFREKKALDYLEFDYLPELIRQRKGKTQQLKIWSAGCATGEEPYSIAILLQRIIPDFKNWDITIHATDINPDFLNKGQKGVYSRWSFRKTPESFKTRYFKELDKNYFQINDSAKSLVTFFYLNLASDIYPSLQNNISNYDVILCRNVLIYFSSEGIKLVASKLYEALKNQGVLLVSPVETSSLLSSQFMPFLYKGYTLFKKGETKKGLISKTQQTKSAIQLNNYIQQKESLQVINGNYPVFTSSNSIIGKQVQTKTESKIAAEYSVNNNNYETALQLYKSGSISQAEEVLEALIAKKQDSNYPCFLLLAKIFANKNQLDKSEKMCHKAIQSNKTSTEAHYLLASVYMEQGKSKEAVKSLHNTLFLDPDFVMAHFLLGNILKNTGETIQSNKHFGNALKSLAKYDNHEIIVESDGLTAGRLAEIINSIIPVKNAVEVR